MCLEDDQCRAFCHPIHVAERTAETQTETQATVGPSQPSEMELARLGSNHEECSRREKELRDQHYDERVRLLLRCFMKRRWCSLQAKATQSDCCSANSKKNAIQAE